MQTQRCLVNIGADDSGRPIRRPAIILGAEQVPGLHSFVRVRLEGEGESQQEMTFHRSQLTPIE